MRANARVVADSITAEGHRLTTFEANLWRPLLAEQNTHSSLARNSASSRAIPVKRMLKRFWDEFEDNPIEWPSEVKGMQGGPSLVGESLSDAQALWSDVMKTIGTRVQEYVDTHPDPSERLHKSLLNRLLENGLWQTQIISGTSWDGYFWQRRHKDADPHIRAMAEALWEAREDSTPTELGEGDWHLPYWGASGGHDSDWADAVDVSIELNMDLLDVAKACSTARCARVSYLTQSGVRNLKEDLDLYGRLTSNRLGSDDPPHASPASHVATPWAGNAQEVVMPNGVVMGPLPKLGMFVGWWQHRHEALSF